MQSIPPQSGVMPCGLHGYRHEEALALRARRSRPAAAPLGIFLCGFTAPLCPQVRPLFCRIVCNHLNKRINLWKINEQ
jgi:hypothetical protein